MVWRGRLGVSADTGGHLGSVSFGCSSSAHGRRQRTRRLFPGTSDHPHPEVSKGAADTGTQAASTVLWALLSQAEVQLSSGKRLYFNKAGTTSPNAQCPSAVAC